MTRGKENLERDNFTGALSEAKQRFQARTLEQRSNSRGKTEQGIAAKKEDEEKRMTTG
jgi:hypothetical protein